MDGDENPESKSFALLDERIRRWIWRNEWTELREVQERAIPLIIKQKSDVLLASATASGKTEAAFLPILTRQLGLPGMGLTIYISPLSALINDQFGRLRDLCKNLMIPVHPWHGGISASVKKHFFEKPEGVILITPESLEALFCNHGFEIPRLFSGIQYIVVDELHSFIGNERGKQVQALLHLIDLRTQKKVIRIGLSATLGDMKLAAAFLSGFGVHKRHCEIVEAAGGVSGNGKIRILLKGVCESLSAIPKAADDSAVPDTETAFSAAHEIAEHLFQKLLNGNNLIFPNARSKVEYYTHILSGFCEEAGIANQFYAHHGNLSKEIRGEAEDALKSREQGATVICTNTLELGIDIGYVQTVVQIESPPSVASLRQRAGRSGRRPGEAQALRAFTIEEPLNREAHIFSRLRESTFQMCACITLLLEGWCEAPRPAGLHLSTLTQQVLALIAERGGVFLDTAYDELCESGPFSAVSDDEFTELVQGLVNRKLVEQDRNGLLLFTEKGERMAGHFSFYAAFSSENEYRIVSGEKTLGTLPVNSSLQVNDFIIFAGKSWRIKSINNSSRTIEVTFYGKGRPPVFTGSGFCIDPAVRKRMRELYESGATPPFADEKIKEFLNEGREQYARHNLSENSIIEQGRDTVILTWLGDRANHTLQLLLKRHDITAYTGGLGLTVPGKSCGELVETLDRIKREPRPSLQKALAKSENLRVEKWDWALPRELLIKNYASLYLAFGEAEDWLNSNV
ncbi:MAG: DEAD/DEAH box helicase [Spirochaetaceae bacterium]|jgi:ATP-dependent Lhr-like helicase|nr:DEAD/DEAH box helicase [Spirochaetaceae bacterium]